jgi:colanic acid/amylovoran biosynthesis glycosyltransferase
MVLKSGGKKSSMKVAAIVNQYPVTSETFLYTLFNNLNQHGFDVTVICRNSITGSKAPGQQFKVKSLLGEGSNPVLKFIWLMVVWIKFFMVNPVLACKWLRYLDSLPVTRRKKMQIIYRSLPVLAENTDIIYFSFGGLAVSYLELIRVTPERCFFSLRGSDIHIDPLVDANLRVRLREAISLVPGVHCVCEEIRERANDLVGQPLKQVRVIYTALDEYFLTIPEKKNYANRPGEPLRIISVGRLDWRKGFETGMMAVQVLKKSVLVVEWHIYGEGEYRTCLEHAIRDLQLQGVVFLHGKIDHHSLVERLAQSDVFFLPSVSEGISNGLIEAMALGLPAVASDVSGISEVIHNEETGLLVAPRDWQSMASSIENLARSADLRRRLGEAASKYVRATFTTTKQAEKFTEFFGGEN